MQGLGAYEADRASALSGVPESTLYLWARERLITPSASPEKIKLWAWADLVAARAVYWLRHPQEGDRRKPTPMATVRALLAHLDAESVTLGDALADSEVRLFVDRQGMPHVDVDSIVTEGRHRFVQSEHRAFVIDLLSEFRGEAGAIGPDLRAPSKLTRIRPGVLGGEPHIAGTRIETRVIGALRQRGFTEGQIVEMYPGVTRLGVHSAIALERRLASNARRLAAA